MMPNVILLLQNIPVGADNTVSVLAVAAAGLLAFFSPCVLPIIPLYMGYLSGNRPAILDDDSAHPEEIAKAKKQVQRTTLINTIAFVLGISVVYLIIGFAATSLAQWFHAHGGTISKIGGGIIIILGALQLYNHLGGNIFTREHRFNLDLSKYTMNPLVAFLLGFTFSFAWTPCIGPILVSVIALVANADTQLKGLLLMLVYTIGFTLPLLLLGIFTEKVLGFLKKNRNVMKYTTIIGSILLIAIGILMVSGVIA